LLLRFYALQTPATNVFNFRNPNPAYKLTARSFDEVTVNESSAARCSFKASIDASISRFPNPFP
jgi:hypothetical protein